MDANGSNVNYNVFDTRKVGRKSVSYVNRTTLVRASKNDLKSVTIKLQGAVQQIAVQQKAEPAAASVQPTAMSSGVPRTRPPPRNVSFAGPDGELVLSPAQLRS